MNAEQIKLQIEVAKVPRVLDEDELLDNFEKGPSSKEYFYLFGRFSSAGWCSLLAGSFSSAAFYCLCLLQSSWNPSWTTVPEMPRERKRQLKAAKNNSEYQQKTLVPQTCGFHIAYFPQIKLEPLRNHGSTSNTSDPRISSCKPCCN